MATLTSTIPGFDSASIKLPAAADRFRGCETDEATLVHSDGYETVAKVVNQHQHGMSVLVARQRSIPVGQPISIQFGSKRLRGHAIRTQPWGAAQRIELRWS